MQLDNALNTLEFESTSPASPSRKRLRKGKDRWTPDLIGDETKSLMQQMVDALDAAAAGDKDAQKLLMRALPDLRVKLKYTAKRLTYLSIKRNSTNYLLHHP